ncbi:MAG: amidohydrolase family protein [Chloroflexota bacterium]
MRRWSLLIRGGRVVDPASNLDAMLDVALVGSSIDEVGEDLDPALAEETLDAGGRLVIPGLIDPHVHLTAWIGCEAGHVMLARAGVATAIDVAGPVYEMRASLANHGAGLNVGCVQMAAPDRLGLSREPSSADFRAYAEAAMREGALGIKLLGGHFPFSPEATYRAVQAGNDVGAHVVVHVGTTRFGGTLDGLRELLEMGGDNAYQLAHVNSYCRGKPEVARDQAEEVLRLLVQHPRVTSESYLDPHNGVPGIYDANGLLESAVTRQWIAAGGFPPTRDGVIAALRAKWTFAVLPRGRENQYITGEEGAAGYRDSAKPPALAFIANDAGVQRRLATAKDEQGNFIVPALGTDGGGLPRNTTLHFGLGLVEEGLLTLGELVHKASAAPAGMFGLRSKGTLAPGADADVCLVDLPNRRATDLIVGGHPVMRKGEVIGTGGTLLVREVALSTPHADGIPMRAVAN